MNTTDTDAQTGTAQPDRETGSRHAQPEPLTLFVCGPAKCDHAYDQYAPIVENGRECGETLVCSKCGRTAFEDALWD